MRRYLFLTSIVTLSACTTPQLGVLAAKQNIYPSTAAQIVMADDSSTELQSVFPPGQTIWAIKQPTSDAFGQRLVSRLRGAGYAVREFVPTSASGNGVYGAHKYQNAAPKSVPVADPQGATLLTYVVDDLDPPFWRVKLVANGATFSRSYNEQATPGAATSAVGSWVEDIH